MTHDRHGSHSARGPAAPDGARREALRRTVALGAAAALPFGAAAQAFPEDKPVWLVVPFGAGGAVDLIARSLATDLAKSLGRAAQVENRVGAGGNIAAAHVARSRPDGHTMMVGGTGNAIAKQIFANLPYDPLVDLTPIAMLGMAPSVLLVSSSLPVDDVRGLVAMAKAKPGVATIAHGGAGTVSEHLAGELFKLQAGIDMTTVAYKGGAAAMTDIIGGQVTAMFTNLLNAMKAAICLFDIELAQMPAEIREAYRANKKVLGIFPVAAYNGGPRNVTRLMRSIERMGVRIADLRACWHCTSL